MWTGLTKALAGIQFSGSPSFHGRNRTVQKNQKKARRLSLSFDVKNGENLTRSNGLLVVSGLELPVSWRKIRWPPTKISSVKGRR